MVQKSPALVRKPPEPDSQDKRPVIGFLSPPDHHALALEIGLVQGGGDVRDFVVVDGDAALLNLPPGVAGGGAQAAEHRRKSGC